MLNIWTIYYNTTDFPEQYVARRFVLDKPQDDHFADKSIDNVRGWIFENASHYGLLPHATSFEVKPLRRK